MKRNKRYFISLMLLIAFLCGYFSINKNLNLKVYAVSNVFSVEEYTNDDYLLKPNGQSSGKNIREFANEVKAGKSTYYPELAEVIPRQYLESQEKNATWYCGFKR